MTLVSNAIISFAGEYRFLSNFYPCRVTRNGVLYRSVEHAYQAAKAVTTEAHDRIALAATAMKAKQLGRRVQLWPDWELRKLDVMRECLRSKFGDNPQLRDRLLSTGDRMLVEGNTWHDHYWGVCDGRGENWLGRLLMEIRDECRR